MKEHHEALEVGQDSVGVVKTDAVVGSGERGGFPRKRAVSCKDWRTPPRGGKRDKKKRFKAPLRLLGSPQRLGPMEKLPVRGKSHPLLALSANRQTESCSRSA